MENQNTKKVLVIIGTILNVIKGCISIKIYNKNKEKNNSQRTTYPQFMSLGAIGDGDFWQFTNGLLRVYH